MRPPDPTPATPAAPRARATGAALGLVLVTSALHVWYAGLPALAPEEAYAWQQARHLSLSYLDHPPLAAWSIRLAVDLLGTSERTVRLAATAHAAVAAWFFFLAGRRLFGPAAALWALAGALATPLFALGQAVITSDAPLLAGWCAALYFTVRALRGHGAWLVAAGAAAGLASLGKYSGALLLPQIALALALDDRGRRHLRSPWPWLGLAAALAAFSPVLAWNARHGWASFDLQLAGRVAALEAPRLDRVMRFLGLQALLVTPIVGGVVWVAAVAAALRFRDGALRLCAIFSLPALALLLALSPFTWVGGNWSAPAYPAALLAAGAFLAEAPRARRGLALAAVGSAALATSYLHAAAVLPALPFPARKIATLGWRELAARVDGELRRVGPGAFVLGCGPEVASALAFYLPGRPETFSADALGGDGLHYAFWRDPAGLVGREGIVVRDRRARAACEGREEACAELSRLRPLVPRRRGQPVTTFELFRCRYPDAPVAARR